MKVPIMNFTMIINDPHLECNVFDGVVVVILPDLSGYCATARSIEDAKRVAREAIEADIRSSFEVGEDIPRPLPLTDIMNNPDYTGKELMQIEIDVEAVIRQTRRYRYENTDLPVLIEMRDGGLVVDSYTIYDKGVF